MEASLSVHVVGSEYRTILAERKISRCRVPRRQDRIDSLDLNA
jgi:hypothetical protein